MLSSSVSVAPFAGYSGGVVLSSSASPMATLDSVAVFEARAIEIGVIPLELDILRRKGWNTLGRFAFACGYSPGGPDESRLLRLAATMTGAGDEVPSDVRLPRLLPWPPPSSGRALSLVRMTSLVALPTWACPEV